MSYIGPPVEKLHPRNHRVDRWRLFGPDYSAQASLQDENAPSAEAIQSPDLPRITIIRRINSEHCCATYAILASAASVMTRTLWRRLCAM